MYKVYFSHAKKECRQDNTFDSGMFLLTKKKNSERKIKQAPSNCQQSTQQNLRYYISINCYSFFFFSRNTPDITSRFGYCQHSFGSSWSDLLSLLESTFECRSVCYANNLIKFTNLEILITFLDSICLYLSKSLKISTTFICFSFLLG